MSLIKLNEKSSNLMKCGLHRVAMQNKGNERLDHNYSPKKQRSSGGQDVDRI